MKMPIGEIFDRYTIVELKKERLPDLSCFINQQKIYLEEVKKIISGLNNNKQKIAWNYIKELTKINASIWELEYDIRAGLENKMSLTEVGRRAIKIRNYNGTIFTNRFGIR